MGLSMPALLAFDCSMNTPRVNGLGKVMLEWTGGGLKVACVFLDVLGLAS